MFVTISLLCVAASGTAVASERHGFWLRLYASLAAGAALGGGVGLLLRRPILCAVICASIFAVPPMIREMTDEQQRWLINHGFPQDPDYPPLRDP